MQDNDDYGARDRLSRGGIGAPCWLNHGVIGEIGWPRVETSFRFGEYEIVAKPPTADHEASLHIDLGRYGIDGAKAMSVLSQVLSLATWVDDAYSVLLPGWSGNPVPVPVPRHSKSWPSSILNTWPNARAPLTGPDARHAVAIYREAFNVECHWSIPYAALGYFKLLEIRYQGHSREQWLETTITSLQRSRDEVVQALERGVGTASTVIARFLLDEGRHAVAHANRNPTIDPDDTSQVRRLSLALPLFRTLARTFIRDELGVSEDRWAQ